MIRAAILLAMFVAGCASDCERDCRTMLPASACADICKGKAE